MPAGRRSSSRGCARRSRRRSIAGSVSFDAGDGQGLELEFSALGDVAELGPDAAAARLGGMAGYDQPCRVRGTVRVDGRSHAVDGLGQRGHSWGEADWGRIALARTVTAWTDARCATLTAIRPAGAHDHAAEETWAALWEPEAVLEVEHCRLSTTYDADGHTRRAGLELWAPDAEWPRRAAGEVLCGSSLELGVAAARLRVLPLAPRGAGRRRALRHPPPRGLSQNGSGWRSARQPPAQPAPAPESGPRAQRINCRSPAGPSSTARRIPPPAPRSGRARAREAPPRAPAPRPRRR